MMKLVQHREFNLYIYIYIYIYICIYTCIYLYTCISELQIMKIYMPNVDFVFFLLTHASHSPDTSLPKFSTRTCLSQTDTDPRSTCGQWVWFYTSCAAVSRLFTTTLQRYFSSRYVRESTRSLRLTGMKCQMALRT
jgi:hypothetical protein